MQQDRGSHNHPQQAQDGGPDHGEEQEGQTQHVQVHEGHAQRHRQAEAEDEGAQVIQVAQEVVEPGGVAVLRGAVRSPLGQGHLCIR